MGYGSETGEREDGVGAPAIPSSGEALLDENAAIRSVQAGSKEEFRLLVTQYKNMIFALIKRQVGEADIAEEIAQEVFVKAYLNIKRFRFEARFATWLTRIALNESRSYFATRRYKQRKLTESFDNALHDKGDYDRQRSREEEEQHARLLNEFREALAALKPKFRDVLVLCGLEGRPYQEAAEILSIPVGTVRSRLNKARLLMKEELGVTSGK